MGIKSNKLIIFVLALFMSLFSPALVYAGNPPDAGHSSLSATEVPADGSSKSTVTVTLQDSSGTPLAGDSVQLSNSTDSTLSFSPSSAVLNASGSATFTATSSTAGTDAITVTDTTTSTALSALGQIIFDPVATATPGPVTCTNQIPLSAPNLYSVVVVNGTATLYLTPPPAPYDGFTISYGLDSNADAYNTTFSQGVTTGAVQYSVNSLTPNTKYFFKVRANNGCATGTWSNVFSSSGNSTQPTTGPSDLIYLGFATALLSLGGLVFFLRYK